MVSTKEAFSSLDMSKVPPIVLGDDSLTKILGKGRIDLDHGQFSNVLYVPSLTSNFLLVYPMTHTGSPKKFIFSPDEVEITEISSGRVIAKGVANHAQKVYMTSIDLDHGQFRNVLYVPSLTSNLLSMYQMTHTGSPK